MSKDDAVVVAESDHLLLFCAGVQPIVSKTPVEPDSHFITTDAVG